jgi:hypothetical protein
MYKKLKNQSNFLSFNGIYLMGKQFCFSPKIGDKTIINPHSYSSRYFVESSWTNNIVIDKNKELGIYKTNTYYIFQPNVYEYLEQLN